MTLIATPDTEVLQGTALGHVSHVQTHMQNDSSNAFKAFLLQWPIMAAGGVISQGLVTPSTAEETILWSVAVGAGCSSAYLAQGLNETRAKLSRLRHSFNEAVDNFAEFEKKLVRPLTEALDNKRDTALDFINIKKYPIRNGLAATFLACTFMQDDPLGKISLLFLATNMMLSGAMLKEEHDIDALAKTAKSSATHLELMRDYRLNKPEMLEGFDFR